MMMSQRHLSELLEEDQEPFLLQNYIADRRTQIKRPSTKTHLQVKKRKPISETSSFTGNLCKNACFFSFQDSPDMKKSPLFEFPSPVAKSPCRSPNDIFLTIPARTAAVLLEAALRIQKQSSSSKTKTQNKSHGFGLFGSLLKRLTHKNRNRKREIGHDGVKVSLRDTLRWDSSVGHRKFSEGNKELQEKTLDLKEKSTCEISAFDQLGFSCSCNGSRPSSAVWSETNEDKSMDVETSSSSQSEVSEETDFVSKQRLNTTTDCACCDNNGFCESPFRFVLQMSPFPGSRTPDFMSPAASPSRRATEEKVNNGAKDLKKFLSDEEEEEDKEQCSPVSVLDPPFEEDDDGHENENKSENDDEDDGFDLECSYAILQRAKQQLLHKLRRFEKLAELDPLELEKRILDHEEDDNGDIDDQEKEEDCEDYYMETSDKERNFKRLVAEALTRMSSFDNIQLIPEDLKRLVSDIILEEETELSSLDDREVVMKRVCKRLELWKEVESNTINMMVEQDFCREEGWKRCQEQVREIAGDLELDILSFLVQELSEEHVC
ncbi:Histone-lysine N-methyltransferase SETD1B-like protein [Quillaja saponaria]|uniref:Histone-lysine N-methyltransferase SETD1B-like protein n=1 Tax=Quillaja saponaria TaxID=32244 RepID=A0AAD7PYI0_QUISA|nr:Histone-lysine N-methyltransferase SETD1B-like protein [Quillaja saponaria]